MKAPRKLHCLVVGPLAVAMFALIGASPALARSLDGSTSGTATVHFVDPSRATIVPLCAFPTPCALGTGHATGDFSDLGRIHAKSRVATHFTNDPNPGDFKLVGTGKLEKKHGTLFSRLSGHGSVTSSGDFVIGSTTKSKIHVDIVDGTGKFNGATGHATVRQTGTLVDIFAGNKCLGALNRPCLQFQSADHSTWNGRFHVPH